MGSGGRTIPGVALPSGPPAAPSRFWSEPRGQLVRKLVRNRLPVESVLVDACWTPASPLASLVGIYAMVACVGPGGEERMPAGRWPVPTVRAEVGRLPMGDDSVDAVLLLDVVEWLDDDRAVLVDARRVLRTGGMVLVTAPAAPHLWSTHDERIGRRRRYTDEGVTALATGAGLLPEQLHHFQFLLYPLFAVNRRLARRRPGALAWEQRPPALLERALTAVNRAEVTLSRRVPWPRGSSLVLVARKP